MRRSDGSFRAAADADFRPGRSQLDGAALTDGDDPAVCSLSLCPVGVCVTCSSNPDIHVSESDLQLQSISTWVPKLFSLRASN